MPPRYSYWTIIVGGQPTAFRAATQEELLPTLKQTQVRQPDAVMKWFARGKLWDSPEAAAEAMRAGRFGEGGGERRGAGWRPGGEHEDPRAKFKVPRAVKRARFVERMHQDDREPDRDERPGDDTTTPQEPRPPRPGGERPFRPSGDRPFTPRSDRPFKPSGDRPPRPSGERPFRPSGDRPFKPSGDRPFRPRTEDRGERPFRPKGPGDRPFKPSGDRPFRPRTEDRGERPFRPKGPGDRPFKPSGDRPFRPRTEDRGERPFRPKGPGDR
ncbi:MAG: hypothetical protein WEB50_15780, partial [Vicinamibacterales bacterium]